MPVAIRAQSRRGAVPGLVAAVALSMVAARNGGYFPTAWGWIAFLSGWVALIASILARADALSPFALRFVALIGLVVGWVLISASWSNASGATVLEAERDVIYGVSVVALGLILRRHENRVVAAIVTGTIAICVYSLATRLFPERVGSFDAIAGYRLAAPIGYWNALGLFAAIGALLALGCATRARGLFTRAASGASLVLFTSTIYFTFSRGSWLALGVALVVSIALDGRRLQACAAGMLVGVAPLLAVVLASREHALTTLGAPVVEASRQGHRLAGELVVLAAVGAALSLLAAVTERRWTPNRSLQTGFAAALVVLVLGAAAAATATWGAPWSMAQRGWHAFTAQSPQTGANLNNRLFHLSGSGRIVSWRGAIHEWEHSPMVGTGAGTFETWWLAHRPQQDQIRDAHSLYLETMGELGIVGLLLLLATLAVPLVAAVRARHEPYVPFLAAAFVAWVVHAGVDWDWEIPAVTLPALACAVAICAATPGRTITLGTKARIGIGTVAAAIAVFGLVAAIGNQSLASSQSALISQNYATADLQAQKAARWAPWLADPWIIRGQIAAHGLDDATARADFRKAIGKDPSDYLAWYGLAGVEHGAARRRAVAEVVRLNPLSDEAKELRTGS